MSLNVFSKNWDSKFQISFLRHFARGDNWHEVNYQTGDLGYGWIHYAYIRILKPDRVLCIGSKYGFIPAVCALACKHNQQGQVDFVDAGLDVTSGDDNHWGGVGFWRTVDVKKYFGKFGLEKYLTLHVMLSSDFQSQHPNATWEYIHVDGDHSYQGVTRDYQLFWPQLKNNGIIGFHDIYPQDSAEVEYGVWRLWQELVSKHSHSMEFPGKYGLGIIQKP